jgi:hypothetical protein
MDIFVTVMMVAMVLLVVVVGAAVFVQQSTTLREIQNKLDMAQEYAKQRKDPELLRRERLAIMDPLMVLESQVYARKPQALSEEEIELIVSTRSRMISLSDDLKAAQEWLGPPYDLEWFEYLERMPVLKTLYLNSGFADEPPPQITSGN